MVEPIFLADEAATIAAAQDFAPHLKTGDAVLLRGDLGAGKSTFARALIRALPLMDGTFCPEEEVPSPTYTLVQTYERAVGPVAHFDLYRLGDPEEVLELGLDEILSQGLALIEWPDRLGVFAPKNPFDLRFDYAGDSRVLQIERAGTSF